MSKYKNQKCRFRGITFDSKREAKRFRELQIMEKAGIISDLRRQVKYKLIPVQKLSTPIRQKSGHMKRAEREVTYIADFVYIKEGQTIVEDCKGYETDVFKIKRKLMLYIHGIQVIQS